MQNFDPSGRERYVAAMNRVAYMEFRVFEGEESKFNFCCYGCEYMREEPQSPTGYWCKKVNIPDKPHGCCDLFEPLPEIKKLIEV